ncbi:acyl-CoA dehydrogenase [Polymorphobacter fuscus]|uniref:Acyl-CoA dehydrogenase n=1 Tax=Sandarakinorhabdus fusca TaxID=1439888 RepID=A0A7C9KXZ3_9SPHN|nr:acyl-CoA dehydrogenase [Polymorphobacter fuscus]KAB7646410.1 acyl-CoA dehydrogenase [Polymorphobacter fuscus]MQT17646.1 acyl-CoA dehydrogenase [Polymorphobacter fuscus]NJC09809.1 alkylation response protein AidB-like acyl-CoA dehydrogenase [Polymorphobacter fuscus]
MTYTAPAAEQRFVLDVIADVPGLAALPPYANATPDMVDAILAESGKLASNVFAPLNAVGDKAGARLADGVVTLPPGFADAYGLYVAGGWAGLGVAEAHGGQGLPFAVAVAVQEQLTSANMAFALCMMLSQGAIEALAAHASPELQDRYLARLVSGEWTGTMNLTEPSAGSDVGALKTRAVPHADGSYRIKGTKIYITWGEHDAADNIVHLVLARLPDAPAGTKGISLFLCPKILPDGARNDLICTGLEHKLGIHASPTCTMSFGDNDNCVGYLVGAEGAGMRAMFTMMNNARVQVGLQGVAIAEAATQHAVAFARQRVQSAKFGGSREAVRIIDHADVRRTLMTCRALTEATRALVYLNAAAVDRGHAGDAAATGLADLLTPISKAWATDVGVEVASLALQVFGGMGYVEETGAAQFLRDARIAPIYEGTNGIQALDLVGRKLGMDGGTHWQELFAQIGDTLHDLNANAELAGLAPWLDDALTATRAATLWLAAANNADDVAAGATPYLRMMGLTLGGWLLAKQALAAQKQRDAGIGDAAFLAAKITTARFFAEQLLPQVGALSAPVTRGAATLFAISEATLAA